MPFGVTAEEQSKQMELLRAYNQGFAEMHEGNPDLQGRIDAYELAYRMQAEVPGVLDIAAEAEETLEMYGLRDSVTESFGKRCLMARQMVEKGVRFVQLYTPSQSWDGHTEIVKNHTKNAAETDKPIAGLLKDLKRRGLLDSTLVVWMGEFGRTPDNPADLRAKAGRDHNTRAMTIWMAGGGTKPGALVGTTDDLGFKAVEDVYRMRDVHATVMHLMGLNDMKLTYYSAGRNQRLTDTGAPPVLSHVDGVLDREAVARPLGHIAEPPEGRQAHDLAVLFGHQDHFVLSEPFPHVVHFPGRHGPFDRCRAEKRIQERHDLADVGSGGRPDHHAVILAEQPSAD